MVFKIFSSIAICLTLISCSNTLNPPEYMKWISENKSSYISMEGNDYIKIIVKELDPVMLTYNAILSSNINQESDSVFCSFYERYSSGIYYSIEIQPSDEFKKTFIEKSGNFDFEFESSINVISNDEILKPINYHHEISDDPNRVLLSVAFNCKKTNKMTLDFSGIFNQVNSVEINLKEVNKPKLLVSCSN